LKCSFPCTLNSSAFFSSASGSSGGATTLGVSSPGDAYPNNLAIILEAALLTPPIAYETIPASGSSFFSEFSVEFVELFSSELLVSSAAFSLSFFSSSSAYISGGSSGPTTGAGSVISTSF